MIKIAAADGHKLSAYRVEPAGTPKGSVVIVHDIYGVNPHIRKVADSFAEKGYVAIAPSLFDRAKAGIALGYDDAASAEGSQLAKQVGVDGPLADIQAAVDTVRSAGKIAIVGYSWGGYLAYLAANRVNGLACAIAYYGTGVESEFREKRKIPTLLHFGEADSLIPFEEVVQFRANRPDVSAFSYPGAGHGFNCNEQKSYDEQTAQAALERTLFWVSQYVEGQPPILLKNAGAYAQAKIEKKKKKKDSGDDLGPPLD